MKMPSKEQTRESGRQKEIAQRRVLDSFTRAKRLRRQLEALEQDNFQEDPHANLVLLKKKLPQFDSNEDTPTTKKRKKRGDHFKQRFRKTFHMLVEEEQLSMNEPPNYLTCCVPPSSEPQRKFCAVCGFPSNYTCVACGARYCCVKCLGTHLDTRCLKWTA
ncbi:zinc finger HIT domain-containing protein 1-like [Lytechinus pictus]|uniref:zinc finger HIT domain-containing protein 1-like n=1 Tax=Lytechinus variegatus TaxID=7654 RepID=UPI001BB1A97E|nr:zinc finger HIT domain-containing protein 1-like [Lytechinus variegatus]XP_054770655.1 zinc finger HIT domain-containing protein 1-like [Lytechinus pictus]